MTDVRKQKTEDKILNDDSILERKLSVICPLSSDI